MLDFIIKFLKLLALSFVKKQEVEAELEPTTEEVTVDDTIIPIEAETPVEELILAPTPIVESYYSKITRCDSPSGKWDVSLANRLKTAQKNDSKLHISIHANAYGTDWNTANGTEGYYSTDRTKELVDAVQGNMISGCKNRGTKTANFYITREFPKVNIESVLFEGPFMTCKTDLNKLKSDDFRKTIAALYAMKIHDYCVKYGITNISLDAGHGKYTAGKRAFDDSLREWTYNSAVVLEIIRILEQK